MMLSVEGKSLNNVNQRGFEVLPVTLSMTDLDSDWQWWLSCIWLVCRKVRLGAAEALWWRIWSVLCGQSIDM